MGSLPALLKWNMQEKQVCISAAVETLNRIGHMLRRVSDGFLTAGCKTTLSAWDQRRRGTEMRFEEGRLTWRTVTTISPLLLDSPPRIPFITKTFSLDSDQRGCPQQTGERHKRENRRKDEFFIKISNRRYNYWFRPPSHPLLRLRNVLEKVEIKSSNRNYLIKRDW